MKILNPIKIIGIWVLLMIVINIIAIPILFSTTVGGEQRPLSFLMESIEITAYGILLLSILTAILYFKWVKRFWFINLFFFFVSGIYVVRNIKRSKEIVYSFNEKTDLINGSEIKIKKEYYTLNPEKLRSESYWRNGKKDSIWVTYAEDGNVLKKVRYKNDVLIEDINTKTP